APGIAARGGNLGISDAVIRRFNIPRIGETASIDTYFIDDLLKGEKLKAGEKGKINIVDTGFVPQTFEVAPSDFSMKSGTEVMDINRVLTGRAQGQYPSGVVEGLKTPAPLTNPIMREIIPDLPNLPMDWLPGIGKPVVRGVLPGTPRVNTFDIGLRIESTVQSPKGLESKFGGSGMSNKAMMEIINVDIYKSSGSGSVQKSIDDIIGQSSLYARVKPAKVAFEQQKILPSASEKTFVSKQQPIEGFEDALKTVFESEKMSSQPTVKKFPKGMQMDYLREALKQRPAFVTMGPASVVSSSVVPKINQIKTVVGDVELGPTGVDLANYIDRYAYEWKGNYKGIYGETYAAEVAKRVRSGSGTSENTSGSTWVDGFIRTIESSNASEQKNKIVSTVALASKQKQKSIQNTAQEQSIEQEQRNKSIALLAGVGISKEILESSLKRKTIDDMYDLYKPFKNQKPYLPEKIGDGFKYPTDIGKGLIFALPGLGSGGGGSGGGGRLSLFGFRERINVLTPNEISGITGKRGKPFYRVTGKHGLVEKHTPVSKVYDPYKPSRRTDDFVKSTGIDLFRAKTKQEGGPGIASRRAAPTDIVELVGGFKPGKKRSSKKSNIFRGLF
ncbi:hypothetical protein, partial [Sulfuricurvum sp. MLSB]|uniref:hypothetical protein n=1 Tax=Sulfuricurvum sp. MLSB TaxID=1537917 RepID=UPI0005628F77